MKILILILSFVGSVAVANDSRGRTQAMGNPYDSDHCSEGLCNLKNLHPGPLQATGNFENLLPEAGSPGTLPVAPGSGIDNR